MDTKPDLTIMITQWGKPGWLAGCLRSIARQLTADSPVQILIGDDGIRHKEHGPPLGGYSEEFTRQVIEVTLGERMDKCTYIRWPEHCPKTTMHNLHRSLPHATGEWIWLLGNNDAVFDGAIDHLLQVIQYRLTSHIQYLYFNYHGYHTDPSYPYVPERPELVTATEKHNLRPTDMTLSRLASLAIEDPHGMTAIYCGAMRKSGWQGAMKIFEQGLANGDQRWFSPLVTCPYAVHIVENLLEQPAYYIHRPMMLMNYSSTWKQEEHNENWRKILLSIKKRLAVRCDQILG